MQCETFVFQVVASFYLILVIVLVGTNLGMARKRKKTTMDKKYVVQFTEGEGVKFEVVEGSDMKKDEQSLCEYV